MNHKRGKKDTAALVKLREMQACLASVKKTSSQQKQEAALADVREAKKQEMDCENSRNNNASTAMRNICEKGSIRRADLQFEYETFSWATEKLKELKQVVVQKKEVHTQCKEEAEKARKEYIRCENKTDQANQLYDKAKKAYVEHLLYLEAEESEEVAATRHIRNAAAKSKTTKSS